MWDDPEYQPPDWYGTMEAADQCNCTPWELEEQPRYWKDRGLMRGIANRRAKIMRRNADEQMNQTRLSYGSE